MRDARTLFGLFTLVAAATCLPGCNIVGPAVVLIHGPEKTAAAHELDENRPTVVFIDDRGNRMGRRALRQTIAVVATDSLLKDADMKSMLDPKAAMIRVAGEPNGEPTDIATLGRSLGAEVVIYATVDSFSLTPDGVTFQPNAAFRVKVIDCVKSPSRIWPEEKEGHPLAVTMPQRQGEVPKTNTQANAAQDRLAQECGERLAKLFYKHQTKSRVSDTNDRK